MNCTQANEISIVDFLNSRSYIPTVNGDAHWYILRDETKASTKVSANLNRWYDYGLDKGGKLVDLVCAYFTNGDIKEALEIIAGNSAQSNYKRHEETQIITSETKILKVLPTVQHQALKNYLNERKIFDFFQDKISEIHYSIGNKNYFSLGWENEAGGWELRNKLFKGCINGKGITTIIGEVDNDVLDIWEGMFSFLSFLQYHDQPHKVIVLNSVANVNKAITDILRYKKVNLYMDNDKAGERATERFKSIRNDAVDCSSICGNHKDYNDYLLYENTSK